MAIFYKWAAFLFILQPVYTYSFVADPVPCFKNLETNFFKEDLVRQALSLYNIPQGVWNPIVIQLRGASGEVPNRMRAKTRGMVPNPLEYPLQREPAAKLLKEALHEVFVEVMAANAMPEQPTADLIFEYIFSRQRSSIERCLGVEMP